MLSFLYVLESVSRNVLQHFKRFKHKWPLENIVCLRNRSPKIIGHTNVHLRGRLFAAVQKQNFEACNHNKMGMWAMLLILENKTIGQKEGKKCYQFVQNTGSGGVQIRKSDKIFSQIRTFEYIFL